LVKLYSFYMFCTMHCSIIAMKTNKTHKWYIFSQSVAPTCCGTWAPHSAHANTKEILNIYSQLFNFNFNYQHTTRCLDCGEYIYKQLHLGRMYTLLYYLLCNCTHWRWSSTTETCRCYKLRKYIYIIHAFCWFSLAIVQLSW
jgi:hypothetical protein